MRAQTFDDFDDFAGSIRGVVSKMLLRNATYHCWKLRAVDLNDIVVQVGELGSGNIAQGELRSDRILLYLPLTPKVEYCANGTVLGKASFAVLEPGCEFCISTKVAHNWCAVTLPVDLLVRRGLVTPSETSSILRVETVNPRDVSRFREIVSQVMGLAAKTNQIESGSSAANAAEALLGVAASVLDPRAASLDHHCGRPRVPRDQIIASAIERLQKHEDDVVRVGELAAAADVSERTLRNAFNDYFGISPLQYLRLRQLHQVHRALRGADSREVTVSQVLLNHGVWEFSRFAARYRQLFGELPSETLRTKPLTCQACGCR